MLRGARIAADKALEDASRLLEFFEGACRSSRMVAFLATGDTAAAWRATRRLRQPQPVRDQHHLVGAGGAGVRETEVARRYALRRRGGFDGLVAAVGRWWVVHALNWPKG